jgi:hypothetical protein
MILLQSMLIHIFDAEVQVLRALVTEVTGRHKWRRLHAAYLRGSPTSRLCIVPVKSTIGSQRTAMNIILDQVRGQKLSVMEYKITFLSSGQMAPIIMYLGFGLKFTASCMFSKWASKRVNELASKIKSG